MCLSVQSMAQFSLSSQQISDALSRFQTNFHKIHYDGAGKFQDCMPPASKERPTSSKVKVLVIIKWTRSRDF